MSERMRSRGWFRRIEILHEVGEKVFDERIFEKLLNVFRAGLLGCGRRCGRSRCGRRGGGSGCLGDGDGFARLCEIGVEKWEQIFDGVEQGVEL